MMIKTKYQQDAFDVYKDTTEENLKKRFKKVITSCADKKKTNEAIERIEDNLKRVFVSIKTLNKTIRDDEDEAMIAKKGWQCASCDRGLTNFYATQAEYNPKDKFPLPKGDRIARVGQGFSKIIGKIRTT